MKKAKVLIAALLTSGLVLSGCTFEEGLEIAKNWANDNVAQPVVNFFDYYILGKRPQEPDKEKEEKEEKQDEGEKPAPAAQLTSISISGQFKTEYEVGESFDSTGIVVTAAYDDDSEKDVSSQATFSGFSSESPGTITVTVSFEGQSDSFEVTILPPVKRDWTDAEKAIFAEYLHGIVLPFFPVEGATPVYEASDDRVRIYNEEGEPLQVSGQDIPSYAALFTAAEGWEDVSSDYSAYSSAPTGSFWVFERSTQTSEGMRRISVQFFGHDGSAYSLSGDFYLFASDPFSYEFPADLIAEEFEYYGLDPFTIPAPDADDLYFEFYPDSYNDLYVAYDMLEYLNATIYFYGFTQQTFDAYVAKLEQDGWVFTSQVTQGITVYSGTKEFNDGSKAIIEQFYYYTTFSALTYDYLLVEPVAWPADAAAALVEKFAPGSTTVIPECPGGDGYQPYMSSYYNEIDVDCDASLKDTYAGILRDAGWTEIEDYVFVSPNQDIQITLVYTSYGLEIRVAAYIPPAAEWPTEDAAKLLPEGGQDSIPPFEGADSYQYYSDNYGAGITCFVGEENVEDAMEEYAELLIEEGFTLDNDGYFRSPNDEFKIDIWEGTDGAFNIEVSIIAHWPTAALASALQGLVPGATDSFPALEGANKYTLTIKTDSVRLVLSYNTSTQSNAAQAEYIELLEDAGFEYAGVDQYGDPYFNSVNGEFNINPWVSSSALVLDIYAGEFEPLPSGLPAAEVNALLLEENPNLQDSVPGYDIDGIFNVDDSGYYAFIELGLACASASEAQAHVAAYSAILLEANYTANGSGYYGGTEYLSPNGELIVYPYVYGSVLYIDIDFAN